MAAKLPSDLMEVYHLFPVCLLVEWQHASHTSVSGIMRHTAAEMQCEQATGRAERVRMLLRRVAPESVARSSTLCVCVRLLARVRVRVRVRVRDALLTRRAWASRQRR